MIRDEHGRPRSMFKTLRKLHGQGLESAGLNDLTEAFATFMTRARYFSIGHLRRTWSHSAVEFMKYRRRLPALLDNEDEELMAESCGNVSQQPPSARLSSSSFRREGSGRYAGGDADGRKVYVTNVSYRVTTTQLASFFTRFGKVAGCSIPFERNAGTLPRARRSRGIAFVTFKEPSSAERARTARPDELRFYDRYMVVSQTLPSTTNIRDSRKPHSPSTVSSSTSTSTSNIPLSASAGHSTSLASLATEEDTTSASEADFEDGLSSVPPSPVIGGQDRVGIHVNSLPDKVFVNVFGWLDIRERVRVERVCKKWHELAFHSWTQQHRLTFHSTLFSSFMERHQPLHNSTLKAVLHRCGRFVRVLDVSGTPHLFDEYSLQLISAHCHNLEEVDLTGLNVRWQALKLFAESCPNLQAVAYRDAFGLGEKAFWYLFRNCKNLRRVDLRGCKRLAGRCFRLLGFFLDEVTLDGCVRLEPTGVEDLCLKSPNVRALRLNDCHRLTDETLNQICRSLHSLQVLTLCGGVFSEMTPEGLCNVGLIDTLTELRLDNHTSVTDDVLLSLATGCPSLTVLSLAGAGTEDGISENGLIALSQCGQLRHVNLSYLQATNNVVLAALASSCAELRWVSARGCLNVGADGVKALARHCPRIAELDLSGCLLVGNEGVSHLVEACPVGGAVDYTVSVVVGGTAVDTRTLQTADSRVVLDTTDYSKPHLTPGIVGVLSDSLPVVVVDGAEGGDYMDDDDMEDDDFESLTASRSFVLDTLEDDDDFILDDQKRQEWEAEFDRCLEEQGYFRAN